MPKPKSDYSIQTVSNALRLLEAFADAHELGVSELSRRLDLHKNNVFRLLATLQQRGYVEQSEDNDRYRLGPACLELGHAYARHHTIVRRARPILEELVRKVGETAHLASLRDHEVVHLDGVLSDKRVVTSLRVGERLPAHCTALGKVLLALGDPRDREAFEQSLASDGGLTAHTEATLADAARLAVELEKVADAGYALDQEECERGMCCVAAPVRDDRGEVVAAISISGPSFRMSRPALESDLGRAVVAAADQLAQELGYGM
ncbi:MAG: IclR family transcriptional regulator [Actinomycetota bacterium]|nr:IclR family transcriptional regulator [Actinomycetota bacterium]